MGQVKEIKSSPFSIAVFCGIGKLLSLVIISNIEKVSKEGILYKGNTISVKVRAFIWDAIARAYLKCVVGHSVYYGCKKCTIRVEWASGGEFPDV